MLKKAIFFNLIFFIYIILFAKTTDLKVFPEKINNLYDKTISDFDSIIKKSKPIFEKSKSRYPVFKKIIDSVPNNSLTVEVNNIVMDYSKAVLIKKNCEVALELENRLNDWISKLKLDKSDNYKLIKTVSDTEKNVSLYEPSTEWDFHKMSKWISLPNIMIEKVHIFNVEISSLKAELELNSNIEKQCELSISKSKKVNKDFFVYEQMKKIIDVKTNAINLLIKHNKELEKIFSLSIQNSKSWVSTIKNSENYRKAFLENEKKNQNILENKLELDKKKITKEKIKIEKEKIKAQKELVKINKTNLDNPINNNRLKIATLKIKNSQLKKEILELKQKIQISKLEGKNDSLSSIQLLSDIENNKLSEDELKSKKNEIDEKLRNLESNVKIIEKSLPMYTNRLEISKRDLEICETELGEKKLNWSLKKTLKDLKKYYKLNCGLITELISLKIEYKGILQKNFENLKKFKTINIVYKILGNSKIQFRNFFIVIFTAFLLSFIIRIILTKLIINFFSKTKYKFDEVIVSSLKSPITMMVMVGGIYIAFKMLELTPAFQTKVNLLIESLVILNITFLLIRVTDIISFFAEKFTLSTETKLDDQLLPIIRKTVKGLLAVVGITIIMENLGYKVTSLLTGLGLGGLAFALAAKDTLSNFFGSIMLFSDKPFVIGDWVIFNGFEGIIEDIGLRSTRVRTWKDTLITVPNSIVASASIENVTRFRSRRVSTTLKLRKDTPYFKIDKAVKIIREILDSRSDVNDGHYIFYNNIDEYSHNIMIYYFASTTVWRDYLTVRQEVFLQILNEFEKNEICLALPAEIKSDTKFGSTIERGDMNYV